MPLLSISSSFLASLFSDTELASLFQEEVKIERMLAVEAALARAQSHAKAIPPAAGRRITQAAERLHIDPSTLAAGTAKDGVSVPTLVSVLREALDDDVRSYVHFGATSQDIIDTALVLVIRDALLILEDRLISLLRALRDLAEAHKRTLMAGRTRFQAATPITFGAKVAMWIAPLLRDLTRLKELRPRLLVVSLGGASGTQSALGHRAFAVEKQFAHELGLGVPLAPWHAARDTIAEFAGWLCLLTGTAGKIGLDISLLAQSEICEVRPASGGSSSSMPHKANPVKAELLVALARFNAERTNSIYGSMIHAHERDGAAWMTEWLSLPEMVVAAGSAIQLATELVGGLTINEAKMREHVVNPPALTLSEAAVFALSKLMSRSEAEKLVKSSVEEASASGEHLIDVISSKSKVKADWSAVRNAQNEIACAAALVDRVLSRFPR